MSQVITIGLDIAKSVFQVHGVDAAGEVGVRRQIRRGQLLQFFAQQPACLVGIEACASAHYWARELTALGHQIRLVPASYVKPYVKRQKNDAADAEAICEAVTRPTMRFVDVKSPEQQSVMVLHKVRLMLMQQGHGDLRLNVRPRRRAFARSPRRKVTCLTTIFDRDGDALRRMLRSAATQVASQLAVGAGRSRESVGQPRFH